MRRKMKWKKQKIEPCSNCGLNGSVDISHCGFWGLFCPACKKGYVSKFLFIALWKWNYEWRKMRKNMEKKAEE
jgi:hypothetical protein